MRRRQSPNRSWFENTFPNADFYWPKVISPPLRPYVSVFAPRGVTPNYGIQPSDLTRLLENCSEPALIQARAEAQALPRAPELSGPFPAAPQAPERPQSPAEPNWHDYAPKHPHGGFWSTFSDVFSGARGGSGESRKGKV